jgi:hypothetical protein
MARRKDRNTDTQEESMTSTENDVQLDEDFDVDAPDEGEEEVVATEGTGEGKAKEPAKPKRGDLPEGWVTPIQFAKILGERGLHKNREGEAVSEVRPQMVYSYMRNSPKDDRLETTSVEDSNGNKREALNLEEAIAWWERKNARAAERKQNAATKKAKANAPKQSDQALVETGEADPSILEQAEEAE